MQTLSTTASHEIIEAITNPYVGAGYSFFTETAIPYPAMSPWLTPSPPYRVGGEVADMCGDQLPFFDGKFGYAKAWSNRAISTTGDPCIPYTIRPPR